jgi:thioredoxin 1
MSNVTAIGDDSFEREVLQSATPVLIEFWAPVVCSVPSDRAGRRRDRARVRGKLKVVKMNVDENPAHAVALRRPRHPELILFQGGQVKEQIIGAVPKSQLVKAIGNVVTA